MEKTLSSTPTVRAIPFAISQSDRQTNETMAKLRKLIFSRLKKFLFCLFVFLHHSLLYGQKVTLTLSDKFNLPNGASTLKLGNNFYCLDNNSGAVHLRKYDENMKELKNVKPELDKKSFNAYTGSLLSFGGKLLFAYFRNTLDSAKLYLAEMGTENLEVIKNNLLFSIAQKTGTFSVGTTPYVFDLRFAVNPGKTKMLIAYDAQKQLCSCVIDQDLNATDISMAALPWPVFSLERVSMDNTGNRYFSYQYDQGKSLEKGILIVNNIGKESFIPFNTLSTHKVKTLKFANAADNSKTYIYSNYYDDNLMEGVMFSTIDAQAMKINTPAFIPYPDDVKKQLVDLSFGESNKGHYSVSPADFDLVENDAGAILLIGQAASTTNSSFSNGRSEVLNVITRKGPVIGVFINGEKNNFVIIPRKDINGERAECMAVNYKSNFICVYTEVEKNFPGETRGDNFILADAVFDSNGSIMSQKKLDPVPQDNLRLRLFSRELGDGNFIFPVTKSSMGLGAPTTNQVRWAYLKIE